MEQISFSSPSPVAKKLRKYAQKNDVSVSSAIVKLLEFAMLIESKSKDKVDGSEQDNDDKAIDLESKIDKTIKKLVIQNGIILKSIIKEQFDYDDNKMKELRDKTASACEKIFKENA